MKKLLSFLANWDGFTDELGTVPIPSSRISRFQEIIEKYKERSITGNDVTSELVTWLLNFSEDNLKIFMDWLENRN